MALLDAIGTYLQTQSVGTLGSNIMLSMLPDDPDVCVALFESQGMGVDHVMGASVFAVDKPRLRILCRAAANDYPGARTKAEQVRNLLGAIRDTTLSGVNIMSIMATSEIYPYNVDQTERPVIGCDFVVWVRQ